MPAFSDRTSCKSTQSEYGVRLTVTDGITALKQPPNVLNVMRKIIAEMDLIELAGTLLQMMLHIVTHVLRDSEP